MSAARWVYDRVHEYQIRVGSLVRRVRPWNPHPGTHELGIVFDFRETVMLHKRCVEVIWSTGEREVHPLEPGLVWKVVVR